MHDDDDGDEVRAIQMGIHRKAKKERAFMGEKE